MLWLARPALAAQCNIDCPCTPTPVEQTASTYKMEVHVSKSNGEYAQGYQVSLFLNDGTVLAKNTSLVDYVQFDVNAGVTVEDISVSVDQILLEQFTGAYWLATNAAFEPFRGQPGKLYKFYAVVKVLDTSPTPELTATPTPDAPTATPDPQMPVGDTNTGLVNKAKVGGIAQQNSSISGTTIINYGTINVYAPPTSAPTAAATPQPSVNVSVTNDVSNTVLVTNTLDDNFLVLPIATLQPVSVIDAPRQDFGGDFHRLWDEYWHWFWDSIAFVNKYPAVMLIPTVFLFVMLTIGLCAAMWSRLVIR